MMPSKHTRSQKASGYVYLPVRGCPTLRIPVESADVASAMFVHYREKYAPAASDLSDGYGNIYTDAGDLVAVVSYNAGCGIRTASSSRNQSTPTAN